MTSPPAPPYDTLTVADRFLQIALVQGRDDMCNVKLNKLVFIAHGTHLARLGGPLVEEIPQVWTYGPVFPSLYYWVKYSMEIKALPSAALSTDFFSENVRLPALASPQEKLVNRVCEKHLSKEASALTNMTQGSALDYTPWAQAKDLGMTGIPHEITRDYYASQLFFV